MIELFEQEVRGQRRQSSKGNQLKWYSGKKWYKADYTGYEGLAEYVVSRLLQFSSLEQGAFILYDTVQIQYDKPKAKTFCRDFDEQLDTVERLYGQPVKFSFNNADVERILEEDKEYPSEEKERVRELLRRQRRKYQYLFA